MGSYSTTRGEHYRDENFKNSIVVIDEQSEYPLYIGEYIENKPENSINFILKSNEI